jgi:hypothetical protein
VDLIGTDVLDQGDETTETTSLGVWPGRTSQARREVDDERWRRGLRGASLSLTGFPSVHEERTPDRVRLPFGEPRIAEQGEDLVSECCGRGGKVNELALSGKSREDVFFDHFTVRAEIDDLASVRACTLQHRIEDGMVDRHRAGA